MIAGTVSTLKPQGQEEELLIKTQTTSQSYNSFSTWLTSSTIEFPTWDYSLALSVNLDDPYFNDKLNNVLDELRQVWYEIDGIDFNSDYMITIDGHYYNIYYYNTDNHQYDYVRTEFINLTEDNYIDVNFGSGNNTLVVGDGNVKTTMGAGDDILLRVERTNDTWRIQAELGEGDDTADLKGNGADLIDGGLGNDRIRTHGGDDIAFGGEGDDNIHGGTGNNLLDGGAGNDDLTSLKGNSTLNGGIGNDILTSSEGNSTLNGGDSDDAFFTEFGTHVLNGGSGNDKFQTYSGRNTLNGGSGDDELDTFGGINSLNGGDGDDTLATRLWGHNTLTGGAGRDTFEFDFIPFGLHNIRDFTIGEDTLKFNTRSNTTNLNYEEVFQITDTEDGVTLRFWGFLPYIVYNGKVLIEGVSSDDLTQDSFEFADL